MRADLNPRGVRRAGLALTVAGLLGAAAAYASAFGRPAAPFWAGPLLGVAAIVAMTGVAVLAVARPGAGALAAVLLAGGAALALGMAAIWTAAPADPAAPALYWGLPRGAAQLLYGLGLAPALVVPLVYAWGFRRATLSRADLERVRRAAPAPDGSAPR